MEQEKRVVTQDNALVSATYAMSLHEKRLLVAAISQLDPESVAWKQGRADVTITAGEWSATYGTSPKTAYGELRRAAKSLYERSVRIYGDHRKGKNVRWLSAEEYSEDEGRVTLTFSGPILFYLTGMVDQFTSYDLLGVAGLKSIHSIRVYELVCQFKKTGWRQMDVGDLREVLCIGDAYPKFKDFRKRVLDRACSEITQKSDLDVGWEPIKAGRTIKAIKLKCKVKTQLDMFEASPQTADKDIQGQLSPHHPSPLRKPENSRSGA